MKAIVKSKIFDEKKKNQLIISIERKQKILKEWSSKVEELKMELELIKHEYHVRVGGLLLKDNQLDLEILQLQNLKDRMSEGMSYSEAVRKDEDAFYNEILRMQKEQEKIDIEKEILEKRDEVEESVAMQVKDVWKKLIRKFHPDLVMDKNEKTRREEIMKKINLAYSHFDLDTLKHFEENPENEEINGASIERLESILVSIENTIIELKMEWVEEKKSVWYSWKIKKEKAKENIDVFADFERALLDGVVEKIKILQKLREEVIPEYK
ncbi:MAG TPA: hypothetical protein VF189_05695 [Patescibacteria group bacterium]